MPLRIDSVDQSWFNVKPPFLPLEDGKNLNDWTIDLFLDRKHNVITLYLLFRKTDLYQKEV